MRVRVEALLPLSPRDFLILFVLTEGELHGYGMLRRVEEQSDGRVRLDPSNLYRALRRLMREGLVEESERRAVADEDGEDERRRYYGLTDLGRAAVTAEAARLSRITDAARERRLIPGKGDA